MATLSLSLLGGFHAQLGKGEARLLPSRKAQGLLAFLALRPGQPYSREKLAALLWGDTADEQARHSLRQTLCALRKVLPPTKPPSLLIRGETVALNPAAVTVDVAAFEGLVTQGTPGALERAAALYQGELLEGLGLREEAFEEWLRAERERLHELAIHALAKLLAHQARTGATEGGIQTAVRLLALDPLQEAVHRALMRLYVRQGRRGAALRQYQTCLGVLRRELSVEPEPETTRLYHELVPLPLRDAPAVTVTLATPQTFR
ncbi:MAG: winged helix-turn-helix domain-containing protein [Candidatus Rokubacteria bacterium]|nr:winged helix-turn-helix domain-containing protein [Candidatus Rokubacteria bacterium]